MSTRKRKPFDQIAVSDENSATPKKRKSDGGLSERRAGTVNRMVLKNFMCHSLLEVNFQNNICFVTGKNGSGKSAILTALIVGLGGKATLTNRGSSVKGFVKVGKPSASIEIVLCNAGPMAYRPNVYGESITIIRNLSANGGGSYKIKSATGEVKSTQSREVHTITVSLNIQVDNPICILNQDTSRNFLSSNNPKSKFTLFMKATKLESLEMEYKKIQANKNDSARVMNEKSESFRKLQEEIKRLKSKINNHKSIISLKDRKTLLQKELVWAKVRDAEEELQECQQSLVSQQQKLDEFKSLSQKRLENLKAYKEKVTSLEQQMSQVKEQIEVQKRPQMDMKAQIEELIRNVASKKREKQQVSTSIQNKNADAESLIQDLANLKENMSKVEQQKIERINNLAALQDKLKGLDDHLATSKNDLFLIKGDLSHKEEEEKNFKFEILQIDDNISTDKNNLNALRAESGNALLLYGRDMPRIKEMIAQYKHRFQHEPRGPLGCYIKIKDKKWTVAVEGYIGAGNLRGFVVDNKQDNQLLREIFKKVLGAKSHPQIITSKFIFKKHDVSKNMVHEPSDCVSVYNAIEIDDPIVANCIVDSSSPENILLIPSDTRAQELLSDRRNVPKNCVQGITIKGDKYYPDPNYRSYGSSYNRAQFLQIDTKEHMKELQEKIERWRKKKQIVLNQLEEFRNNMSDQVKRRQELEEKVKKVNQARAQIRRQLDELNSTAEPEVQNVQFLEQELNECKQEINRKTADMNRINEEIKEMKRVIDETEHRFSQMKGSTKDLEERVQTLNAEIRENQTKQKELATSDDFDKRRIKEFESRVNGVRSELVLKQNEVKRCKSEASDVGDRPSELRRITTITSEITEIKHKISRLETDTENVNDVMDKHAELSEKYRKNRDIMEGLQEDINDLTLAIQKRSRHYKLTENYFVTLMKYSFKKILEFRQFKGNLDIDITAKKLELIVIPQHGSQGHTTTSNLSGGERSFSTVALLYSLWQCMELPFYFLDEFDVYMDKLNRTKVIEILLHHAKSKPELQFVFLTPQDVSFIEGVNILRLQDPERFNV